MLDYKLKFYFTAPVIEHQNLKLAQLKTVCPDHVHRILEDLLPYLESVNGRSYVQNLLKLNELNSLVPQTELISTVSSKIDHFLIL